MRIDEKLAKLKEKNQTSVSFEFFPAKTRAGVSNLLRRIEEMAFNLNPTFVTLTWRSAFEDETLWLDIGRTVQKDFHLDILLHLTCHLPVEDLKRILTKAREAGIQNILALRGDPPIGSEKWRPSVGGLSNAYQLVELIRKEHGDYFCIAVACYAEVHIESLNNPLLPPSQQCKDLDIQRLKLKIEKGANFIISQFFFDIAVFEDFVKRARAAGITCPILPGYLPIQNYASFQKFTSWCKTHVPPRIQNDIEAIKGDDEKVKAYGIQLAVDTSLAILKIPTLFSLHYYTMNLSFAVTEILSKLNMVPSREGKQRDLPWSHMNKNEVRPIFWSNRESSYLSRTAGWDEFPNGRWGDNRSPAYGELTDYYLSSKRDKKNRLIEWGDPKSEQDVFNVFVLFLTSSSVKSLPWCEENSIVNETKSISSSLQLINECGYLTINSQPRVNGVPSNHPVNGWGGDDGYVFQKGYVEFFTSEANLNKLLLDFPKYPHLSYHCINKKGVEYSNILNDGHVNAVTWGIFPEKEVIQPTVVDPRSFKHWKDEAFDLWMSQWGGLYEKSSVSYKVIQDIHDSYFLVNIVDNDFSNDDGDIFSIFKGIINSSMSNQQLIQRNEALDRDNKKLRESVDKLTSMMTMTNEDLRLLHEKLNKEKMISSSLRIELRELQGHNLLKL